MSRSLGLSELTTPHVADDVDTRPVERDEAKREEDAHGKSGLVAGPRELGNHRTLQTDADQTASQADYEQLPPAYAIEH